MRNNIIKFSENLKKDKLELENILKRTRYENMKHIIYGKIETYSKIINQLDEIINRNKQGERENVTSLLL